MRNKKLLLFLILLNAFFVSVQGQNHDTNSKISDTSSRQNFQCAENPDNIYQRKVVLDKIAEMLNVSIPEFEKENGLKIKVENENFYNFYIYDLTDISNNNEKNKSCIKFINNHVYHIYPGDYEYSFSHIVILEDGNLKVFKSVNCKNRGDKIEDAVMYLQTKLADDENKMRLWKT